jgi:hypothetical protein
MNKFAKWATFDPEPVAIDVCKALQKHYVPLCFIDEVFEHAKGLVEESTLISENSSALPNDTPSTKKTLT